MNKEIERILANADFSPEEIERRFLATVKAALNTKPLPEKVIRHRLKQENKDG